MNEPAANDPATVPAVEPAGARGASMAGGFGRALAQARLRTGLSQEQVAASLRLHPRQLAALENEDLDALPAPAYVSGFVRNYARELKLDAGPLIEDLNQKVKLKGRIAAPDLGIAGGEVRAQNLDGRGWRQLVLAGIVLALICAGILGTWMARPGARPGNTAGHAAPSAAPSARAPEAEPSMPSAAPAATPQAPAAGAAPDGPALASPADGGTARPPQAPAAPPAPADAAPAPLKAAPGEAAHRPSSLVLRFNERSWFEISGTDGRVLLSRNGEAGSTELLNTSAPLRLVVGRAGAVQVEYRGRQVDLKPYSNSNGVARLLLADGRVTSGGQ